MSAVPAGAARIFVNGGGEVRAAWRALLFLLLAFTVLALFARVQPLFQRLTGLSAAAAGTSGSLVAALVAGWLLLVLVDRRRPGALGFALTRALPRELGLGLAITGGVLAVVVGGLTLAGKVVWTPDAGNAGGYVWELTRDLALWGVAAAAEEALFRGYLFQLLVQGIGAWAATLLLSALFALMHRGNPNVDTLALLNIFLAGVLLSVAYLRTRSLWFTTALHVGWNWMMGTVLALPVSGLVLVNTPLYDAHAAGPRWVTGGAFGPEGGLAGSIGFGLALVVVMLAPLREAARMRELRPLVDSRLPR